MIQRIEALNYRSLRYVSQELRPFQVLVGPNASGKSTFLDVVALLGDFVRWCVWCVTLMMKSGMEHNQHRWGTIGSALSGADYNKQEAVWMCSRA